MDGSLAIDVLQAGVRIAKFNEGIDYEGVSSQDRLVQGKPVPTVDRGFSLFHQEV